MIKLDGTNFDNAIINDLMTKCADDTRKAIHRICDIAPNRLRHHTKDRGIVVHSRWGLGYELDQASRKVIAAVLK